MIPFAVKVKGLDDPDSDQCRWALAASPDGLLIVNEDRSLQWYPLADCTFVKLISPEAPKPVVAVQIQQPGSQIGTPNREKRRQNG